MMFKKKWATMFDPNNAKTTPHRYCDMPGCREPAEYRAPKSRHQLHDYYWFCFSHIREYNKNWDYFRGMNTAQIEEHMRSAAVWDKPSWKLGRLGKKNLLNEQSFHDPLRLFQKTRTKTHHDTGQKPNIPQELQKALQLLEISWPLSLANLKKRYTKLARKYHPDTNGGDADLEEKFKKINAAYSLLRTYLTNMIEAK
ncbi:J domain-containing protein [Commensalibacter sp. ESL0382]|uniref:J domain-containing protein n=1 Tax=Commensalibacter sp. ESL0382 TaxID=2676445 RepID=UPI0012D87FC8|nr:J domain-containing protein [Commensalibacter sp. ESL0382]MUG33811.1 DnaJ domain-containing protein [Commensalibacter sp. ESL0382]